MAPLAPSSKKKRYTFFTDIRKNRFSYLLILPITLYTVLFGYLTLPYMVIAFQKFNYGKGLFNSDWVGLKNFEFFFKSNRAGLVTWNTIKLNLLFLVFVTLIALALSIMLSEIHNKWFVKITQSGFLFPNFISWVVVGYMIFGFFSTEYGLVNQFLKLIGLDSVSWYSTPGPWTWILVILKVWKDVGMKSVIFLAAITGLDSDLYEAASLDGANRWQQTRCITLPLLMPTVMILSIMSVGKIFNGDFGMIYPIVQDNGMLFETTDVIDTYVFRAFRTLGDPSQAMAVSLYQSLVGFVLVYGTNWLVKKLYPDGALF